MAVPDGSVARPGLADGALAVEALVAVDVPVAAGGGVGMSAAGASEPRALGGNVLGGKGGASAESLRLNGFESEPTVQPDRKTGIARIQAV